MTDHGQTAVHAVAQALTGSGSAVDAAEVVRTLRAAGWSLIESPTDPDKLEVFRGGDELWYWHRQDPHNHELGCQGEGYNDKRGAIVGALRWNPDLTEDDITVLT